jgi:hypothetical protein
MNFQSRVQVDNQGDKDIMVCIEPWGDVLNLKPRSSFSIVAESPLEGELDVVRQDDGDCTVYAWTGSTCKVFCDDQIVQAYLYPVPGLPPGWSTRNFVERIFKGK